MPRFPRSTVLAPLAALALVAVVGGCTTEPDDADDEPSWAESGELVMAWLPNVDDIDSVDYEPVGDDDVFPEIVAVVDPTLDVAAIDGVIDDVVDGLDETIHAVGGYASVDLWHGDFVLHVSSSPGEQRDNEIATFLRIRADERIVAGGSPTLGYEAVVADAAQVTAVARDLWPHVRERSVAVDSVDGAVRLTLYGDQPMPDTQLDAIDSTLARLGVGGATWVDRDTGSASFAIAAAPGTSIDAMSTALGEAEAAGLAPARIQQGTVAIDRDAYDATTAALMLALSGEAGVEYVRVSTTPSTSGLGSVAVANDEASWRLLHATLVATALPQGIEVRLRPDQAPPVLLASPPLSADSDDLDALAGVLQIDGARATLADGLELALALDAPDASAVALADLVAGSAWATAEIALVGEDEHGATAPLAHLSGGTAAAADSTDPRATAFLDRWAELHGDDAVGGR